MPVPWIQSYLSDIRGTKGKEIAMAVQYWLEI